MFSPKVGQHPSPPEPHAERQGDANVAENGREISFDPWEVTLLTVKTSEGIFNS